MKRLACVGAALAGALLCAGAHGEALYVIDQLIVSVNSTPDESGERIASIHSGDSVQVLERHDAYAHVRLPAGTEGAYEILANLISLGKAPKPTGALPATGRK